MGNQSREVSYKDSKGNYIVVPKSTIIMRLTLTSIGLALGTYFTFQSLPKLSPRIESWQAKVMYAFRWQLFSLFALVICISFVAFVRLLTPALNPMDPRGEPYVELYVKCLQNTLEQLVINVPAQLILASYLDSDNLRIIPIMVAIFVGGRVAYWLGYPIYRAYGFAATFFPTILVYILNFVFFLQAGSTFQLTEK